VNGKRRRRKERYSVFEIRWDVCPTVFHPSETGHISQYGLTRKGDNLGT